MSRKHAEENNNTFAREQRIYNNVKMISGVDGEFHVTVESNSISNH